MDKLLDKISGPKDLKKLAPDELARLAGELRSYIIEVVSQNGGHLASNLGVVELTIALHYVFDSPTRQDHLGRRPPGLHPQDPDRPPRSVPRPAPQGGILGLPEPRGERARRLQHRPRLDRPLRRPRPGRRPRQAEGDAQGHRRRRRRQPDRRRRLGGPEPDRPPPREAHHRPQLQRDVDLAERRGHLEIPLLPRHRPALPPDEGPCQDAPQVDPGPRLADDQGRPGRRGPLQEDVLPRPALRGARPALHRPGPGPQPAVAHRGVRGGPEIRGRARCSSTASRARARGTTRPRTTRTISTGPRRSTSRPASPRRPAAGSRTPSSSAGRPGQDRRGRSQGRWPSPRPCSRGRACPRSPGSSRTGSTTSASPSSTPSISPRGSPSSGFKPVCAIYSTFLQRAYDQVYHDVCLQDLPVVFALDRAGVVPDDGPTHQGLNDIAYLRHMPNIILMAPRDENELQHMLHAALGYGHPVGPPLPQGRGAGVPLDPEFRDVPLGQERAAQGGERPPLRLRQHSSIPPSKRRRGSRPRGSAWRSSTRSSPSPSTRRRS